jgi:transcriptional regulator
MYLPPQFKGDRAQAAALINEHPFASLVSVGDAGLPYVTHLPLHLEMRGEQMVLLGHVAKPNPHWRYLQARPQAVVTFPRPACLPVAQGLSRPGTRADLELPGRALHRPGDAD